MEFLLARSLNQFLANPLCIIGLVFITAGVAMAFLARRVTRMAHHTNNVSDDDKLYVTLKIAGLVLVGIGFLLVAINIIIYIANR